MYKERSGVFETNSSSTHSICITKEMDMEPTYPKKLVFRCEHFGWEEKTLSRPEEKAAYLYASILSLQTKKEVVHSKKIISKILSKVGVSCEFDQPEYFGDDEYCFCDSAGIDHAGEDYHYAFVNGVLGDSDRLLRYLFSEKSFVLTGNDNDATDVEIRATYPHEEYYKGN